MTNKLRDFIAVFLLQLVITLPFYMASVYGLTISNIKVTKVTSNSATIEWNTNLISNGRVKYGKTTALGFTQRHDDFLANHTVAVFNGIDSDTSYFFSVESTDLASNNAVDNNSNSFYTFHTTDIMPPPQVTGLSALSATSNSIFLSWSDVEVPDLSHYIIYRNRIPIGNATTNRFNDTGVSSATSFNYKVSAVDNSGNEGPQSDTVIASTSGVDSTPPLISNVDVLPATDITAKVTWVTDENSTTIVVFGINKTDKSKGLVELVTNHTMILDGLAKGSRYIFVVKSCDASNNCANSSNQTFTAGKDTTIPFINLSIPRYFNRRTIDIIGTTEPFSSVTSFVNDMNTPKRSLSNNEVGVSGKFIFSQMQLEQDNIIKVVMVDKSGNKNQKIFETSIDTEDPIVQLSDVPSLTSKIELPMSGTVNEPVTISVFVDSDIKEISVPYKIENLSAPKIGQNSVELHWVESTDKDFSHYVVYREDASPIALTKPANFNLFIDALVDSGKSYTYQISQVNIFANEGPKSEPITVTTLSGGAILNLRPADVDIFADFRKPVLVTNASGNFNFTIRLNKGDGTYLLKLVFTDRADNNVVLLEKTINLDTKKPEVKITSPPSGSLIFENVANEIDIIGTTKPNARVHLFIDRTPFSFFNQSIEISGLPNEIQNLPEAQLDAKCRSKIVATSFCRTGADFSVDADSEGNFKFDRVDLTAIFGGASRISEVPPTEFRNLPLNPEAQESKKTILVIIATDPTGQRGVATQTVNIGTCWSGNQSWDVIPLTQYQSPTLLSTERFAEGTETIYFYFNYSYIGRGTEAKITSISLAKACGTREVLDSRFNVSCQVLPAGNSPTKLNKEGTLSYSAVTLSRFPGMEQFLADDWKNFFKAINNELTFPFKVRITYEHSILDEYGQSKKVTETQTACDQVSYVVDKSIIDPRKVLPDWLLFDAVDFLQDSIKTLTDVQEKVNQLLNYVAVGCLASFGANFAVKVFRIWAEFADETLFKLGNSYLQFNLGADDKNQECKEIADAIQKSYGSLKLKYFSDADLKRCFPNSAAWWGRETNIYTFQRATCDRLFGHSAPSGWTETEKDDELHREITSAKTCSSDFGASGQKIRAENCKDIEGAFSQIFNKGNQPFDKKCFRVQTDSKAPLEKYVYTLADDQEPALTANKIYKLTRYEIRPTAETIYAIKIDDNWYMTKQQKTCAEVCGGSITQTKSKMVIDGKEYDVYEEKPKSIGEPIKLLEKEKQPSETPARISQCVTANQCREWHAKSDPNAGGILLPNGKLLKGYTVETKGYTSDCFYENGKSVEVVSDTNANLREECCCINGRESQFKDVYYQPEDVDTRLPAQLQKPVHESKSDPLSGPKPQPPKDEKGYSDMKWSYRYWKTGYLNKKYNPNRYINGRDVTACFGQDNWFYKVLGKEKEILVVDPFKQDTSTLQCVYLTGVNQRLQLIKNIMQAMSTCLIQVRITGRADAGVCKELFTQHVCGLFWQGIRWFIDGCTPSYLGINAEEKEEGIADFLRKGFRGITQGVSEAQKEITDEYSNAKLNDLLGSGEESIARKVCLFAFGYDWEINAKNLVDAAYSAPYATLVQAVTRSREFLTVDPVSLKPKYEYRASWVINPGCDLERYDVQLACVSRKELDEYPNSISCGALGAPSISYVGRAPFTGPSTAFNQCDCLDLPQEQTTSFFSDSRIKQNSLVDKNFHNVIESDRRYDHLKFILRTDRKIPANIKSNCFPTGYDKGVFYFPIIDKTARDIADCTAQPESGLFTCSGGIEFFNRKGIAELLEVKINGENANIVKELSLGSPLDVLLKVRKTGQNKCAKASINDPISPRIGIISENGTSEVPLTVTNSLTVSGRGRDVSTPENKMSVSLLEQNNNDVVNIRVEFISKDTTFSLNDPDDLVYVENINENDQPVTTEQFRQLLDQKSKGEFTVSKGGAKIKIEGVTLNSPQLQGQQYRLAGVIIINPQKQLSEVQGSQPKTLTIELFHTKDDNPDECSLSESILKREYRFVVTSQAVKTLGPNIQEPKVKVGDKVTNIIKQGDIVAIVAVINDRYQLKQVDAELTAPDGTKTTLQKEVQGDTYTFVFDARNAASGDYNGVIIAKSKNENLPESKKEFKFRVQ